MTYTADFIKDLLTALIRHKPVSSWHMPLIFIVTRSPGATQRPDLLNYTYGDTAQLEDAPQNVSCGARKSSFIFTHFLQIF